MIYLLSRKVFPPITLTMSTSILRDAIIVGTLAIGVAMAAANKEAVYEKLDTILPQKSPRAEKAYIAEPIQKTKTFQPVQGMAVSIPKNKADGQFWTEARVNNGHVRFLVDTGASSVALTPEDARKAGIRLDRLKYDVPIATAGGQNVAAYVNLKSISIGPVTIRNVKALVVPEGLSTSLLGMSYLGELQKVEATPHALILRL